MNNFWSNGNTINGDRFPNSNANSSNSPNNPNNSCGLNNFNNFNKKPDFLSRSAVFSSTGNGQPFSFNPNDSNVPKTYNDYM